MTHTGAGADFLQLHLGTAPPRGSLTTWLVDAVRGAIADGRLPPGTRVPPTRALARDLGISRGVAVEAYQRLTDEGLLTGRVGAGTEVAAAPLMRPLPSPSSSHARDEGLELPADAWRSHPHRLPVRLSAEAELDLSPGVPDLSAFPRAAWLRAERAVLNQATPADLGYGDPRGSEQLRAALAPWLARARGLRARPEEIVVVAGVAQSLSLLAHVLLAHGRSEIAVEDPGSRGTRDALAFWGLDPLPVPVDSDGLMVDELAATGLRAAILTPAHQFPTGVVLAPQRRREVLDWAARVDGLVIEDDYDAEHRYDRAPVPALHASAPDRVAHTGSTSKTLAPGIRIGWLVPPPHLHADVVAAKHASDLGNPALPQLVLAQLLTTGMYDRHLRALRVRQRARRDAVLAAVREHVPSARVGGVAAGLHLLITFPRAAGVDDTELAARARAAGVVVHPMSWHRQRPGPPGVVIGYAAHPPDRLRHAIEVLGRALTSGA